MRNGWYLFTYETGVVSAVVAAANLEDRGTAGGLATGVHIVTIRIAIALTLLITTSAIIYLTISIIRM